MEFESLSVFFAMGGYAAYVWPAFAVTAIVLIVLLLASARALRTREADLLRLRAELRADLRAELQDRGGPGVEAAGEA